MTKVMISTISLVIDGVPGYCTVIVVPARIFDRKTTWIAGKLAGRGDHK